jgi:hypothetical protein
MPRYATKVKRVKRGTRGKRTRRNVRGKKKTVIRRPRKYMRGGCDKCSDDNCSGCNGRSTNFRFSKAVGSTLTKSTSSLQNPPPLDPQKYNADSLQAAQHVPKFPKGSAGDYGLLDNDDGEYF